MAAKHRTYVAAPVGEKPTHSSDEQINFVTNILCAEIGELVKLGFNYSEIVAAMKLIIDVYDDSKGK